MGDSQTQTQTEPDRPQTTVTKVGGYIEVRADSRQELGDKLYGPDDTEAECHLAGLDMDAVFADVETDEEYDRAYDHIRGELYHNGYDIEDVEAYQANYETVNRLLRDAVFNGHPVLFKTNGYNLDSPQEALEIPHFGHSAVCDDHETCRDEPGSGGIYRLFDIGDLILDGEATVDTIGTYALRDDVRITLCGIEHPTPGTTDATRVE